MTIVQWIIAALFQCFITSLILLQCGGCKSKPKDEPKKLADKKPKSKKDAKKADPAKPAAPASKPSAPPAKPDEPKKTEPPKVDAKPTDGDKDEKKDMTVNPTQRESLQLEVTQVGSVKRSVQGDATQPTSKSKSITTQGDPKEVKVTPAKLQFKDGISTVKLQVQNKTDKTLALKMKCSDNEFYKFKPVFFCLKPNEEHEHEVTREKGASVKNDKLLVVYTQAKDSDDAKKIYEARPAAKEIQIVLVGG